ncbi:hypothetical protein CXG81DRAFT_29249 [Caulochytrium protostelioides]|uniref:Protein yippee-like n=1 Tax=Caulochytrium protostelioides TaxID=1555241 RepID=A0A4P9XDN0_9FUNG|nr:yippee-like protein [Caulochytrium protostelioides]RKP03583.1 hypothetical protein CXG81DRAFT_29249 [Caulochytrium protostelioides]|eukprot:RKP03583.1 hypothetical protein CXG81DRAFT_29249 [Caulochytrium protostelioides]
MGVIFKRYLDVAPAHSGRIFGCLDCKTHFSTSNDILSKAFQGQYGKAYLFNTVINVAEGVAIDRHMTTGVHTVCDIRCVACNAVVGWKYLTAWEPCEKYKEGRYILERNCIVEVP